jgi:hypothetical protein
VICRIKVAWRMLVAGLRGRDLLRELEWAQVRELARRRRRWAKAAEAAEAAEAAAAAVAAAEAAEPARRSSSPPIPMER